MSTPSATQVRRLARRGLRKLVRRWWSGVRPGAGVTLPPSAGDARAALAAGRVPQPGEQLSMALPTSGPWAGVNPFHAPGWRSAWALVGVTAWAGGVALRVRQDLRGQTDA